MALISQRQAIKRLRETGRSFEWCENAVRGMRLVPDGKRMKVSDAQVSRIIEDANREAEVGTLSAPVRPIAKAKLTRIAERCF